MQIRNSSLFDVHAAVTEIHSQTVTTNEL